MNSSVGTNNQTIIAGDVALPRGVRCTRQADGQFDVTGATSRGDMITLNEIAAGEPGPATPSNQGTVPIISLSTAAVGDLAYSAADGKVSTTSTNTFLVGRYRTAVLSANSLADVQLLTVA